MFYCNENYKFVLSYLGPVASQILKKLGPARLGPVPKKFGWFQKMSAWARPALVQARLTLLLYTRNKLYCFYFLKIQILLHI